MRVPRPNPVLVWAGSSLNLIIAHLPELPDTDESSAMGAAHG